jgi:hypothetical protein
MPDVLGGAGVQIQDARFGPFTAIITVNGTSTFSETGDSTGAADGSAIFIGWKGPLTTIQFETTAPGQGIDFAIGPVSIASVPEPSTWAMMLLGFVGLGYAGYRRARAGQLAG